MTPTLKQTFNVVVRAMNKASANSAFGRILLMGGKTKGKEDRERWLCEWFAKAFITSGFRAKAEHSDGRHGRIDIAILRPENDRPECAIEVKFYFCHQHRQRGKGHRFLQNRLKDFKKREHLGVRQQAVVLAGDYQSMPPNGRTLRLYNAKDVIRHLKQPAPFGFARFEKDLFESYKHDCEIFPSYKAKCSSNQVWQARYRGASERVRAWVLGLRPQRRA